MTPREPGSRRPWFARWPGRARPLGVLLALAGLAVAVRFAFYWQLPLPFCLLRALTGIPCPACGCTRSLLAWSHWDVSAAFRFNPLFAGGCVMVIAWGALGLLDLLTRKSWAQRAERLTQRRPVRLAVVGLAALNWIYLCLNLPK